jgi:hypothetical protein
MGAAAGEGDGQVQGGTAIMFETALCRRHLSMSELQEEAMAEFKVGLPSCLKEHCAGDI